MKSKKNRDARRALTRRQLIKYTAFVGASLGLPRWKVFEAIEATGGVAMAQDAACAVTNRSVHIVAGIGGFAWFQLLWPHIDVAASGNQSFAFHAFGEQTTVQGTDRQLVVAPETPWKSLFPNRQVTALMAGRNETHTQTPVSSTSIGGQTGLFAAASALQSVNPTLVPVIAVANVPVGNAAGAPRAAAVPGPDSIVELFNSAASRAGGALDNSADAELFESSYKSFLALHAAAGRPTVKGAFGTGRIAANLLGKNLADALRPTDADLARYGVNAGSQTKLLDIAKTLITTAKAFKLGLTSSVIMSALNDDPHGAFNDMATLRSTAATIGMSLDAFMADLMEADDPTCSGSKIGENTVISIHGDTPKTPLARSGWPDGTPGNSNWMYVLGAGYLKSGWHGGILRDGTVRGFDPATGLDNNTPAAALADPAGAAVLYAVAKGDMRRVQDFYRGDIAGIVRPQEL